MKQIKNVTVKIIQGHTYDEYMSVYGKRYLKGKLKKYKNLNELRANHKYYEINKEYYEVDCIPALKLTGCIVGAIAIVAAIATPIVMVINAKERYVSYNFQYWNNCDALNTLKSYVQDVVTPRSANYIPKQDRVAVFDMDGTLFGERSQIYIEWMYFNDFLNRHPEKKDHYIMFSESVHGKEGEGPKTHKITMEQVSKNIDKFMETRVSPTTCIEDGVTYNIDLEYREANAGALLFSGLTIDDYIKDFDSFLEKDAYSFNNLKFKDMFYKPMIEVVEFLKVNNFDVYIVSGTDRFMVRDVVNKHITIPTNKVIGMDVSLNYNVETKVVTRGPELRYKNVKKVKVELITQEICKKPVLSFGNSSGDVQMHDYTITNNKYKCGAYMVLADDNDREWGYDEATIRERNKMWKSYKYNVFSMRDDFKTIYGDNVTKKDK